MQCNIIWAGRSYESMENCLIETTGNVITARSTIIGVEELNIYRVDYKVETDRDGQTTFFNIESRYANSEFLISGERKKGLRWYINGKPSDEYTGCLDLDISLTAFTNTLPIRRLGLSLNESQVIEVIYCDVLHGTIRRARQQYTKLSADTYHFQNIPNDFEARIMVDDKGFVIDYPELFERRAIVPSD